MALALRLCLNNHSPLLRRSPLLFGNNRVGGAQRFVGTPLSWTPLPLSSSSSYRFSSSSSSSSAVAAPSNQQNVADGDGVASADNSSLEERRGRRGQLWRGPWDLIPFRPNSVGGGLGNALLQLSHNLNKVLENWGPSRWLHGRMKEDEKRYRLRFEVPGLSKDDVRVTIEDGFLVISGERKEEEEDVADDDQRWYSHSYGYYNTSLVLPEDAKVEEIKAELKDGVLYVTIPRLADDKINKNVKEVEIQ